MHVHTLKLYIQNHAIFYILYNISHILFLLIYLVMI
jgi:hypothetical protein